MSSEEVQITLTREQADYMYIHAYGEAKVWRSYIAPMGSRAHYDYCTEKAEMWDAIAAQLRAQRGDAGEGE